MRSHTVFVVLMLAGCHSPAPGPAAPPTPAAGAPTVAWQVSSSPEDSGTYALSNLPAVSADASAVLLGVLGADDARGTPHLRLVVADRRGARVEDFALPPIAPGASPTAALVSAAAFLQKSQAKHGWGPLVWHHIATRDSLGGPYPRRASFDGFDLSWDDHEIRLVKGDRQVLDKLPVAPVALRADHPPAERHCGTEAYLSGVAVDEARALLVTESTWIARDGCYADADYAVYSWAK